MKKPAKHAGKRTYEKPLSLHDKGEDFESVLRVILKSPPMPKAPKKQKEKKVKGK